MQSLDACHLPEMTRDGEIESMGFLIQKEGKLHPGNMIPSKVRAGRMFNCKLFLRPSCWVTLSWSLLQPEEGLPGPLTQTR